MTRPLLFLFVVLAIAALAAAFSLAGYLLPVLMLLLFGLLWMVALLRRWTWASVVGLFLVYAFAAAGFWLRLSTGLLLVGATAGFLSWDLTSFSQRLLLSAPEDDVAGLERRHILRLFLATVAGLFLSLGALFLPAKISFGWSLLLVLLSVLGIGRVMNWLMRNG
jgi:hypothetical protein